MKSLSEISNEMRDLAARARSKRLAPARISGRQTTISNLGMYGIDRFDAVINPPQSSIMAIGRAEKRPVVKDDALKIATMMSVTLLGRSPRHRRRARRRAARRLQGLHRRPGDHAGVGSRTTTADTYDRRSSSAPAPAAMSPRSARRSSA